MIVEDHRTAIVGPVEGRLAGRIASTLDDDGVTDGTGTGLEAVKDGQTSNVGTRLVVGMGGVLLGRRRSIAKVPEPVDRGIDHGLVGEQDGVEEGSGRPGKGCLAGIAAAYLNCVADRALASVGGADGQAGHIGTWIGINVGRVLQRGGVSIAKVPEPGVNGAIGGRRGIHK